MMMVEGQPFPTTGLLADNMNRELAALRDALRSQNGSVYCYCYIVDTVQYKDDHFVQTGSGPNFQGDVITLCTCKHQMRCGPDVAVGAWVAGIAGRGRVRDSGPLNYLVYLMKITKTFSSQREIWNALPHDVRLAKAATVHRLGDLYEPLPDGDPFDPRSYSLPRNDHSHHGTRNLNEWHRDIDTRYYGGTRPLLLEGDQRFSFLWNKPIIALKPPPFPRTKKVRLSDLLDRLI